MTSDNSRLPSTNVRYRKRPIEVEAIRFPDDGPGQFVVSKWIEERGGNLRLIDGLTQHGIKTSTDANWHWLYGSIETQDGTINVHIGDFIIHKPQGTFYSCNPDIFEMTYEAVL